MSLQISYMSTVPSVPFKLDLGFNVKIDGYDPVELKVNLASMPEGEYITTMFWPGWNPEIVREIKSGTVSNVKVGY